MGADVVAVDYDSVTEGVWWEWTVGFGWAYVSGCFDVV